MELVRKDKSKTYTLREWRTSLAWRIEISDRAKKDIERLDRLIAKRILAFLQTRLLSLNDPRSLGEALRGSTLGSYWKYRVGDVPNHRRH
jgi:hypothetical protein